MNKKMEKFTKMNKEELQKELKELKQELFKLRFNLAMNGLENPNKITETKRNIARVNTALTKLEMSNKE